MPYEPEPRLVEYARDFARSHLEVSQRLGAELRGGGMIRADRYLAPWADFDPWLLTGPGVSVYVPDRPDSSAAPDLRYKLEWTDQLPPMVNEFDPVARAVRWRDQDASASKVQGACYARSNTNGADTDVQAGVGILFRPTRRRGRFQFRPLVLWRSWVTISADPPPVAPPHPLATAQSYGAARLVAQSWRASDGGDFRTDAVVTIPLWNEFVFTPNRFWAQANSGVANPFADGPLELPVDRRRVFALWAIVRCWSRSVYAPPSLSSALGMGWCSIPFMIVEQL
jgi:hypothetical protein